MNIPNILSRLVEAQNEFNTVAFANCFTVNANVFDENEKHEGKEAIQKWNEATNSKYQTQLEAILYSESNKENVLKVKVSGSFGDPIELNYHITFKDELIETLEIKG